LRKPYCGCAMNQIPAPGVIAHYDVNLFRATDASKILDHTGKKIRVSPERAALLLNFAIRRCLGSIGPAMESPPSEQAKWAEQLSGALGQSLALLAPSADTTRPPLKDEWIDACSRLFDCGEPDMAVALKRYGFDSTMEALRQSMIGLWFAHAFAVHARDGWRQNLRGREERRTPEAAMLIWAQVMGDLYAALVEANPARQPIPSSPFIRFCEEVRKVVLKTWSPPSDNGESMRVFMAMLRSAEPERVANFICRNVEQLNWEKVTYPPK